MFGFWIFGAEGDEIEAEELVSIGKVVGGEEDGGISVG